jgi:uncharacterized OB-fold protein
MSEISIICKKCKKCGKIQHIEHYRCIQCKNTNFETIESTGDCKLLTYTILTTPPTEYREKKSYALGIIEFSNGLRAMGQITTTDKLQIGMKLRPKVGILTENLDGNKVSGILYEPI